MLISADPRAIPKIRVRVELRTLGDECLLGTVFVNPDQRVSDLMNSTSTFLPFERSDGGFELIAKSVIARLLPVN